MSGGTIASLAFLALALVLPLLALRRREIDWARGWKMAAIWLGLFILGAMLFGWIGICGRADRIASHRSVFYIIHIINL